MIYVNIVLAGLVVLLIARSWLVHQTIGNIVATIEALNKTSESLSTRISFNYDYALAHHEDLSKTSVLITGIGGSITSAFREIKRTSDKLGVTNVRVHDLEIGLSEAIPNIKESLMRVHEKLVRDGARINDLETRQDPKRYVDTGLSYGGTD